MAKYSISYLYEIVDKYTKPLRNITKNTKSAKAAIDKAADSAAKFGRSLKELGTKATLLVSTPLLLMGKAMINAASDAEETRSKYATVFKSLGQGAEDAADKYARSFGLAGSTARKLIGDTGDMLTGFGLTEKAALDLSLKTNELAADLASFTNCAGGAERASAALTSGLLGEREAMKSLGIAILEQDVKKKVATLRSKGMQFNTMREAKAYATLQLALEQSKNAIGDISRTKNSYANVSKRVSQRVLNLSEGFGKALIPVAKATLLVIEKIVNKLDKLDASTKNYVLIAIGLAVAIGPVLLILGGISMLLPVLASGFALLISPITLIGAALTALGIAFGVLMIKSDDFWSALKASALGTVAFVSNVCKRIGGIVLDMLLAPLKAVINLVDMIPGIKMPKGLGDALYFSKIADSQINASNERYSNMLVNPAAQRNNQINLTGNIGVTATSGAKADSVVFNTDVPSNLGLNVAGAR